MRMMRSSGPATQSDPASGEVDALAHFDGIGAGGQGSDLAGGVFVVDQRVEMAGKPAQVDRAEKDATAHQAEQQKRQGRITLGGVRLGAPGGPVHALDLFIRGAGLFEAGWIRAHLCPSGAAAAGVFLAFSTG